MWYQAKNSCNSSQKGYGSITGASWLARSSHVTLYVPQPMPAEALWCGALFFNAQRGWRGRWFLRFDSFGHMWSFWTHQLSDAITELIKQRIKFGEFFFFFFFFWSTHFYCNVCGSAFQEMSFDVARICTRTANAFQGNEFAFSLNKNKKSFRSGVLHLTC